MLDSVPTVLPRGWWIIEEQILDVTVGPLRIKGHFKNPSGLVVAALLLAVEELPCMAAQAVGMLCRLGFTVLDRTKHHLMHRLEMGKEPILFLSAGGADKQDMRREDRAPTGHVSGLGKWVIRQLLQTGHHAFWQGGTGWREIDDGR